ncbi:MAG: arsenate reductase ArsC [Kiritimatiellae bacterium]|nr:arsenate reductase ArsC [Kiritimatiellia bacterium]
MAGRGASFSGRKTTVLFVCVHNSARSVMAEAWLNHLYGDEFAAESAGLSPGVLNPFAVAVMREAGIDISCKRPRSVTDPTVTGRQFEYVITVCDDSAAEGCPVFPGGGRRLHWSFPDPSALVGSDDYKLPKSREIRDAIRRRIEEWVSEIRSSTGASPSR